MNFSPSIALLVFALAAFAAAYSGVVIAAFPKMSRRVLPFSGLMLLMVSLLWVLPDLAEDFGWVAGAGWMLAGFVAFRFFDIVKPWPVHIIDRRTTGGMGAMADDLLAAAYAAACISLASELSSALGK